MIRGEHKTRHHFITGCHARYVAPILPAWRKPKPEKINVAINVCDKQFVNAIFPAGVKARVVSVRRVRATKAGARFWTITIQPAAVGAELHKGRGLRWWRD